MNSEMSQVGAKDWKIKKPVDEIAGDADMFKVPDSSDYIPMGVGDKTDQIIMTRNSASKRDLAQIKANLQVGEETLAKLKRKEYDAKQREFDSANAKKDNE